MKKSPNGTTESKASPDNGTTSEKTPLHSTKAKDLLPLLYCLILSILIMSSCKKNKSNDDSDTKKEYFLTKIQCTYPTSIIQKSSTFTYSEKNLLQSSVYDLGPLRTDVTYTYNAQEQLTAIHFKSTTLATGVVRENNINYAYTDGVLTEFADDLWALPVVFNNTTRTYTCNGEQIVLDEKGNFSKHITSYGSQKLTVNYFSAKGVFREQQAQAAFYLYAYNLSSPFNLYMFSKQAISSITVDGTHYQFTHISDANGNIIQADIKSTSGVLQFSYLYSYELR